MRALALTSPLFSLGRLTGADYRSTDGDSSGAFCG